MLNETFCGIFKHCEPLWVVGDDETRFFKKGEQATYPFRIRKTKAN